MSEELSRLGAGNMDEAVAKVHALTVAIDALGACRQYRMLPSHVRARSVLMNRLLAERADAESVVNDLAAAQRLSIQALQ